MALDAYHKWLGIPPPEQPPHHYRLLGIALFEGDADVIESAADRQTAHIRTFQTGQHSTLSQQILNELAAAKLRLLDPKKKAAYDADLRRRMDASQVGQKRPTAPRPLAVGVGAQNSAAPPGGIAGATCPDAASLSDFALGKLDESAAERISQHLTACITCRQQVADVSGDGFVDLLRAAVQAPGHAANPGRTLVDRDAAGGLETTFDHAKLPPRGTGHRPHAGARMQSDLHNHPDYEIVKELGRGGMGVVYLARNRLMDRLEVLKVLNQSLLERSGALERFQQEIRLAAKLGHINIVAAYSVLRMGDSLVFAMEYVPGQDLAHVVARRGPLRVPNAAYYAHQAALGLEHAHEKGMVHRDIKPNNLMLAVEGKKHIVKILDFGLAKATSEKDGETGLTKSGQILGTPDYLAPEQSRDSQHADIRADIYSLGCTLYFLLSGRRPFPDASLYDVLDAHQRRAATPLDEIRPEVPRELAAVVTKMMAKSPADRYQRPIEVAKALITFFKPGQSSAPAAKPRDDHELPQYNMDTAAAAEQPAVAESSAAPAAWPAPQAALPFSPLRAVPVAVPLSKTAFDTSIDFQSPLIDTEHNFRPPSRRWRLYLATCLAPLMLMLSIAFIVRRPRGTIEIELSDKNADITITIDGNPVDIARLDQSLSLEVGHHSFKVTGKEYETVKGSFTVKKGPNAPLAIACQRNKPSRGTIEIALSDPSAKVAVFVDGDRVDLAGRDELLSLDVGKHQVKVVGNGYETTTVKFAIDEGANEPLTIFVKPLENGPATVAPSVETTHAGAAPARPVSASEDPAVGDPAFQRWLDEVRGLPAEAQVEAVAKKLQELNPGFDGHVTPKIENGVVTELKLLPDKLRNIAPVKALHELKRLDCAYVPAAKEGRLTRGTLTDLSPLAGMRLSELDCFCTNVSDLSPLKGMPLTKLSFGQTHIADFSVLKGMPFVELHCCVTGVSDLSPLRGMHLASLWCGATTVEDLRPLQGMPLTDLHIHGTEVTDLAPVKGMLLSKVDIRLTAVSDLSPLMGMPLTQLFCSQTKVADLAPLKGMPLTTLSVEKTLVTDLSLLRELPLQSLNCDFDPKRDANLLRGMTTLTSINGKPVAEFWKELENRVDQGPRRGAEAAAVRPDWPCVMTSLELRHGL